MGEANHIKDTRIDEQEPLNAPSRKSLTILKRKRLKTLLLIAVQLWLQIYLSTINNYQPGQNI